jgi:hypothetical protein
MVGPGPHDEVAREPVPDRQVVVQRLGEVVQPELLLAVLPEEDVVVGREEALRRDPEERGQPRRDAERRD